MCVKTVPRGVAKVMGTGNSLSRVININLLAILGEGGKSPPKVLKNGFLETRKIIYEHSTRVIIMIIITTLLMLDDWSYVTINVFQ